MRIAIAWMLLFMTASVPAAPPEESVHQVFTDLDATWNARDVEGFAAVFTDDASLGFVARRLQLDGQAAIHRHFTDQFPRTPLEYSHHTSIDEMHEITDGVFTIDGEVRILRTVDGSDPTLYRTFDIFAVTTRVDGVWRIRALRAFQLDAP